MKEVTFSALLLSLFVAASCSRYEPLLESGDGFTRQDNDLEFVCGNGVVEVGEQCDDGNTGSDDGCGPTCLIERCGDGIVWEGIEECDDGNTVDNDQCRNDCTICNWGLGSPVSYGVGDYPAWIATGDLDDDGKLDLLSPAVIG